jgi:hypothetical protein
MYAGVVVAAITRLVVVDAATYTAEVVLNVEVEGEPTPKTRQSVRICRGFSGFTERYSTFPIPALPMMMLVGQFGMLDVVAEVVAAVPTEAMLVMGLVGVKDAEPVAAVVDATETELLLVLPPPAELAPTTIHRSRILPKPRSTPKRELFGPSLPTTPAAQNGNEADDVVVAAGVVDTGDRLIDTPAAVLLDPTASCMLVLVLALLPAPTTTQIATSCSCASRVANRELLVPKLPNVPGGQFGRLVATEDVAMAAELVADPL